MTTCYKVYTIARSTVRRTIRHIVRHTHPAWIVTIVCVGVPLAAMPFVSMIPATNAAPVGDDYAPWSDTGEWKEPAEHGDDGDHHPHSVPEPDALVVVPGMAAIIIFRKRKISVDVCEHGA